MKRGLTLTAVCIATLSIMFFTASCAPKKVDSQSSQMNEDKITAQENSSQETTETEKLAQVKANEMNAFINTDIYFDFDMSNIRSNMIPVLKTKVKWLKDNAGVSVVIEGHCDERGTNEYNLALGDRRANSIKTFLVNSGIPASRLTTISYGEEKPADPGHNEAAWAKNRRGHCIVK